MRFHGHFQPGTFTLIAGPCMLEGRDFALRHAERLRAIADEFRIGLIFKGSYDKANRSSYASMRGPGLERGLAMLAEVKKECSLLVCTDVHEIAQVQPAAEVVDVLQIPAFLCRQTDLLVAAGLTGKVVQIKKGQFLAPGDMAQAAAKVRATGNDQILLTERGTTFGYHNLVVDFRGIDIMKETGYPVLFDATHSVQLPSAGNGISGGDRRFIPTLAKAAVAAGVDGLFMECHLDPPNAKSDAATQWPLDELPALLRRLLDIHSSLPLR